MMPTLRYLELLGLASYEIRGGEKAEVFVRINDPRKIERLSQENYTNNVLKAMKEHNERNIKLLSAFFEADMTDVERWELIEQYFLGHSDYVNEKLHLE